MINRETLVGFYTACGYSTSQINQRVDEYLRLQSYHEHLLDREDITQNNLKEKRMVNSDLLNSLNAGRAKKEARK